MRGSFVLRFLRRRGIKAKMFFVDNHPLLLYAYIKAPAGGI